MQGIFGEREREPNDCILKEHSLLVSNLHFRTMLIWKRYNYTASVRHRSECRRIEESSLAGYRGVDVEIDWSCKCSPIDLLVSSYTIISDH